MAEEQGTLQAPKKRRSRPSSALPPGEFFTRLLQGLIASEGTAGAFAASSIEMFANPANPLRWYAAYLVMVEAVEKVCSGDVVVNPTAFPEVIRDKIAELAGGE